MRRKQNRCFTLTVASVNYTAMYVYYTNTPFTDTHTPVFIH